MRARVRTDSLGNITVHVEGGLDYENCMPLRDKLNRLSRENPSRTITLDLNKLDFVGSSGIGHFVETIKLLQDNKAPIKMSGVKPEYFKVFKLFRLEALESLIEQFDNDETDLGKFTGKGRTFQN